MERASHISSINREKTGENRPDNFLIKFNPPLKLDREMQHSLAIDRLTMTYSWYNIRSSSLTEIQYTLSILQVYFVCTSKKKSTIEVYFIHTSRQEV